MILPSLLGWNIHQNDTFFLTFLIATHFATAIVLLLFVLRDWKEIAAALEIPPGTVKSRLHYARRSLHKVIAGEASRHD